MKTNSSLSWPLAVVVILLVTTSCAISYKVIHTFCELASKSENENVSLELIKDQMQALKDWGGIVLGFFFGAAFNFVTVAIVPGLRRTSEGRPEPGDVPKDDGTAVAEDQS